MPLISLKIRPGIVRDTTLYANEGGWFYCDKIRFRNGEPEKIGGWQKYVSVQLLGIARSILVTADLAGNKNDAIGTNLKYYITRQGSVVDVTPILATDTLAANPFSFVNGQTSCTVTDATPSNANAGDFVTFSGAAGAAGLSAGQLNQNFQIQTIVDSTHYTITLPIAANATTTGGGGAVTAAYEIHVGLASQVFGTGWGAGPWGGAGGGGWGTPSDTTVPGQQIRLWSQCMYGEDIIFAPRQGAIYLWDATNPNNRGLAVASIAGASDVPTEVTEVFMADISRQVFAFGCNGIGTPYDPMFIRWSDFENVEMWTPLANNAAGSIRLSQGSQIITAAQSHSEIVVFTDTALYSLQFSGYPYYWGATLISTGQSIIGPNAKATVNQSVFWMGKTSFYFYDGHVQALPCPIQDYVFSNMDPNQVYKVFAGINSNFSEIWWFYPSEQASPGECDSYVVFNYKENIWHYGTLTRSVWADAGIEQNPVAVGTDGYIYYQEIGTDDGSTNPPSAMFAYIQSSQLEIDNGGNHFVFANRVVPDVTFRGDNSSAMMPSVNFIFFPQDYPGADEIASSTSSVVSAVPSSTVNIEQFTEQAWIRLRGRAMMFRVESPNTGVAFRLGTTRLDVRPDGRR